MVKKTDNITKKLCLVIGKNIKKYREARGMSQTDLATDMGIDYINISRIERGEQNPSLYIVAHACKIFGIKYEDLVK